MPQLRYHTAFTMSGGGDTDLTVGKSYEIFTAFKNDEFVTLSILDDRKETHYFQLDNKVFPTLDYFELIGDYKDVWEEV